VGEEELLIQCPCCSAQLAFDEAGDPYVVEPKPLGVGEHLGIRGIITEDADGGYWRQHQYLYGQVPVEGKQKFDFPTLHRALPTDEEAEPIEPDLDVLAASHQDLKQRNII
jgi:hypothetical protein